MAKKYADHFKADRQIDYNEINEFREYLRMGLFYFLGTCIADYLISTR